MTQNKFITKIRDKINPFLIKFELHILFVILLVIGIKLFVLEFPDMLFAVIMFMAAIIYFISSLIENKDPLINGLDIFIYKLTGMASSVAIVGLLFLVLKSPGYHEMIFVGASSLLIALIYIFWKRIRGVNTSLFYNSLIIRILVLILSSGALLLMVNNSIFSQ